MEKTALPARWQLVADACQGHVPVEHFVWGSLDSCGQSIGAQPLFDSETLNLVHWLELLFFGLFLCQTAAWDHYQAAFYVLFAVHPHMMLTNPMVRYLAVCRAVRIFSGWPELCLEVKRAISWQQQLYRYMCSRTTVREGFENGS